MENNRSTGAEFFHFFWEWYYKYLTISIFVSGAIFVWLISSGAPAWDGNYKTISCIFCGMCFTERHFPYTIMANKLMSQQYIRGLETLKEQGLTDEETAVFRAFVIFDASKFIALWL